MGKIFGKNVKGNAFGDISTGNSGTYFSTPELALESLQEQDDFKRGAEIADSFGKTWDGDGVFEDTQIGEEVCNFVMGYKKLPVAQAVECISSFVEVTESGDFYEDYDDSYIREDYPDIAKKIDKIKSQKTQKNVIMWLNEMDGAISIDTIDPAEIDAISAFCEKTKRGGVMTNHNERDAFMAGFEAGRKHAKLAALMTTMKIRDLIEKDIDIYITDDYTGARPMFLMPHTDFRGPVYLTSAGMFEFGDVMDMDVAISVGGRQGAEAIVHVNDDENKLRRVYEFFNAVIGRGCSTAEWDEWFLWD